MRRQGKSRQGAGRIAVVQAPAKLSSTMSACRRDAACPPESLKPTRHNAPHAKNRLHPEIRDRSRCTERDSKRGRAPQEVRQRLSLRDYRAQTSRSVARAGVEAAPETYAKSRAS